MLRLISAKRNAFFINLGQFNQNIYEADIKATSCRSKHILERISASMHFKIV